MSAACKQCGARERVGRASERTSKWPTTSISIHGFSEPLCSGDTAPFVFLLPEFLTTMETSCREPTYAALLGFGDVVVPTMIFFVTRLFALCVSGYWNS